MSSSTTSAAFSAAADDLRETSKRAADAFAAATGIDTVAFSAFFADAMDGARYWSGLTCVVVTFCGFGPYLLSLHTFLPLWRRLGKRVTILTHVGVFSALVWRVFYSPGLRESIMNAFGGDLGSPSRYACVVSCALAVASTWLKLRWMRDMDIATATGMKGELDPGGEGGELLTTGVYAVVRHPRYAQIMVRDKLFGILPAFPPIIVYHIFWFFFV